MPSITDTRPAQDVPRLDYRVHLACPGTGIAFTEWAIETQLSLAHDYDQPEMLDVLLAFNTTLTRREREVTIPDLVDMLRTRAAEIGEAPLFSNRRTAAVSAYRDQLRVLAELLRSAS